MGQKIPCIRFPRLQFGDKFACGEIKFIFDYDPENPKDVFSKTGFPKGQLEKPTFRKFIEVKLTNLSFPHDRIFKYFNLSKSNSRLKISQSIIRSQFVMDEAPFILKGKITKHAAF